MYQKGYDDREYTLFQAYPAPSYFWQFENGTRTQKVKSWDKDSNSYVECR